MLDGCHRVNSGAFPSPLRSGVSTFSRHSDRSATRPAPEISEERRQNVETARRSWIRKLIDLSRRNNLRYFRPLKTGTLELISASSERLRDSPRHLVSGTGKLRREGPEHFVRNLRNGYVACARRGPTCGGSRSAAAGCHSKKEGSNSYYLSAGCGLRNNSECWGHAGQRSAGPKAPAPAAKRYNALYGEAYRPHLGSRSCQQLC